MSTEFSNVFDHRQLYISDYRRRESLGQNAVHESTHIGELCGRRVYSRRSDGLSLLFQLSFRAMMDEKRESQGIDKSFDSLGLAL